MKHVESYENLTDSSSSPEQPHERVTIESINFTLPIWVPESRAKVLKGETYRENNG
jgi:hypothetical protein